MGPEAERTVRAVAGAAPVCRQLTRGNLDPEGLEDLRAPTAGNKHSLDAASIEAALREAERQTAVEMRFMNAVACGGVVIPIGAPIMCTAVAQLGYLLSHGPNYSTVNNLLIWSAAAAVLSGIGFLWREIRASKNTARTDPAFDFMRDSLKGDLCPGAISSAFERLSTLQAQSPELTYADAVRINETLACLVRLLEPEDRKNHLRNFFAKVRIDPKPSNGLFQIATMFIELQEPREASINEKALRCLMLLRQLGRRNSPAAERYAEAVMKIIPVDPKISPPMAPNLALKLLEHAYRQLGPSNVRRIDLATKALALASIHTLSFPKIFRKELNAMTPPP